jgi:hypothetical protein
MPDIQYVEKSNEQKETDRQKTVTEIRKPDGTSIIRTKIASTSRTDRTTDIRATEKSETKKEIENRSVVSVAILAGVPFTDFAKGLVYGASVSKSFIGPITLGAWGFTDLRFGLSVGLNL